MSTFFSPVSPLSCSRHAYMQEHRNSLFYHVFSNFAPYLPPICCRLKVLFRLCFLYDPGNGERKGALTMLLEISTLPEQETSEEILKRLDWYIVGQVQHLRRSSLLDTRNAIQNLDTDELVQRVRIKFWQALERREIHHPHAYIQLIVRSEFIDMVR